MSRLLIVTLLACLALPGWSQDIVIRNATVHTLTDRGILENTDIRVRGGRIDAIGQDLSAAPEAIEIDADGRPVTPAFFAGITEIGLTEVPAVSESTDSAYSGLQAPDMRPEFDVTTAYNPNSSLVPVTRVEGYGFTLLGATAGGSIIAGQGRVALLDGGYDSVLGDPVMFVNIGREASSLSGGSRAAQWMLLHQALSEVRDTPDDGDPRLLTRSGRAALEALVEDGLVVFNVHRAADILQVIDFARNYRLRAVIAGGAEAWMVREKLAEAGIAVLLDPLLNLPHNFDMLGARLDNAALLHDAGVAVSFTGAESHNARKQRQMAGNAVAHGLDPETALAALTRVPARLFGVPGGQLAQGERADLVLWSGDPLEVTSAADQVILGGVLDSMRSRQTDLRDRYLAPAGALPRAYTVP